MTLKDVDITLGVVISILAILGYVVRMSFDMGKIKIQVDTMWSFVVLDQKTQMLRSGVGKTRSTNIRIVRKGYQFVEPYFDKFLPVYTKIRDKYLNSNEKELERVLFVAFQKELGEFIMDKIAVPNDITLGVAIMIIIQACFIKVDHNGEVSE